MSLADMIIPVLAGLTTGVLGFVLGRFRDSEKHNRETRANVYIEYMSAQAALTRPWSQPILERYLMGEQLSGNEWNLIAEFFERFSNAHSKVLIYGSKSVVEKLSKFYDHENGTNSPDGKAAYAELIAAMRKDSNSEKIPELLQHTDNIVLEGPAQRRAKMSQLLREKAKVLP